jgi:hypothetical protein
MKKTVSALAFFSIRKAQLAIRTFLANLRQMQFFEGWHTYNVCMGYVQDMHIELTGRKKTAPEGAVFT